jgi:hypothetical protein
MGRRGKQGPGAPGIRNREGLCRFETVTLAEAFEAGVIPVQTGIVIGSHVIAPRVAADAEMVPIGRPLKPGHSCQAPVESVVRLCVIGHYSGG